MERNDSSTAMSLLQAGYGEDSEEETSFNEGTSVDQSSYARPVHSRVPYSSEHKEQDIRRLISQDSYTDQPADFISDEDEHHKDSQQEEAEEKEKVSSTTDTQSAPLEVVQRLTADPVTVSSQDENSGSSFAEAIFGKTKKTSKVSTQILVSYVADDQDEDEEANESEGSSDEEKNMDQSADSNSPHEIAVSSPGPRGLAGIDSNNIQLPPEPPGKCPRELQEKISEYYRRMKQGEVDPNKQIQRLTSFRNPSIYEKLIQQFKIDEKGSNFPLDFYNPHMWGKESFYDELDKAQKKDMERREKERKEKTKIEFISGTKKTAPALDLSGAPDEKKRKSKWDAQPMSGQQQQQQQRPGNVAPVGAAGIVNLTSTATGTKATVISAVGTLIKKPSAGGVSSNTAAK